MKLPYSKLLVFAALLISPLWVGVHAQSQSKPEVRVYIAQSENPKLVLRNLLAMFGRKLVAEGLSTAPVSGRFEARSVEDVMSYFQGSYQINWFQNGTTVYVYNLSDWGTRKIYVGGDRSKEEWKQMLTAAGLGYSEFNVMYHADNKELLASGPKAYLSLLEEAFRQQRPDASDKDKYGVEMMVFPLKHASVEDRQLTLRGSKVVTPGALTVLLNLLGLPPQPMAIAPEMKSTTTKAPMSAGMRSMQGSGSSREPIGDADRFARNAVRGGVGTKPDGAPRPDEEPAVSVTADPRTNSILIRDSKNKYAYYKAFIDQLDKPVPMVEIEAMLVEVDQRSLNQLGVEFGLINRHVGYDFPGSDVGRNSLVARPDLTPGVNSIVSPAQFMARLKALAADEQAKVLARPTIVTQDNISAFIDLSQTLYLPVSGERVADVVEVTAGSLLQVTPRVVLEGGEEKIFLRVEIQDGSLAGASANNLQGGIQTPQVQNTSLSTQALIFRDKAILIGGYNRESVETKDYKVPLLGDLPWVGKAFSSTEKKSQVVARLFLITPKLIDEGALHDSQSTRKALDKLQMSFKLKESAEQVPTLLKMDSKLNR